MYTLDLSKLTEEQLKAFELIDSKAANEEREKRSIYTEEDIRKGQIYTDLSKAYFFLKPMYDNMRNTDVKKTITESEILPVLEKVFRFCNVKGIKYEKFAPVAEPEEIKLAEPVEEKTDYSEVITPVEAKLDIAVAEPVSQIVLQTDWMPQKVVEAREVIPNPEPVVEPVKEVHPVETMPEEQLNSILANIPLVNKV